MWKDLKEMHHLIAVKWKQYKRYTFLFAQTFKIKGLRVMTWELSIQYFNSSYM